MLIITKENNSIKVVGQDNPTYPYSGTLVYPLNSVTVVTDKSDMAVFRSALNNDVLFTGLIADITIAGSTVTKEDIGTKFGAIANSASSGGGTGGGGAVDSVNGQTGTVVLTAGDVNAYAKNEVDGLLSAKVGVDVYNRDIPTLATKEELALKADKSSLGDYLLKTEAQSTYETISGAQSKYQAKLTAGTGIEITGENVINVTLDTNIYQVVESLPESEINPNKIYLVLSAESGETNLYTEYLYVNSKWEKIGEYKADVDLTPYLKSSEAASTYATKQELAGEASEREKQDSALGGMIAGETEAREQAITNLTATVQGKLDTATYNSEKATFETKENAAATYQPKGSYLTSIPEEYVTDTELNEKGYATQEWVNEQGYLTEHQDISGLATKEELNGKQNTLVSGTNIKTINSQSLLGEGNIEITVEGGGITDAPNDGKLYGRKSAQWSEVVIPDTSNLATKAELSAKLDTATYNSEKATFALKTEIPDTSNLATKQEVTEGLAGKANTSDLSDYLTTANAQSTYATKSELGAKLSVETYNADKATFALKSELPDTSDFITKATADETYQPKGEYLTSVPENYVTDEELNAKNYATTEQLNGKQDVLVSGTNIKTVNGNSILGEGNIQIETTGGGITDAPSDDKTYGRKNGAWSEITEPDLSNYALKSEVPRQYVQEIGFVAPSSINIFDQDGNLKMINFQNEITLGEAGTNVNVKLSDDFVNKVNSKQDTLVSGTNIKTINGESILGSGDITIEGGTSSYTAGEGIDISEANVISVDKESLGIPTLQTNKNGSTNNYVYSTGNNNSEKTNVISNIFFANDNLLDSLRCYIRYWGNDSSYDIFMSIPNAQSDRAGAMSSLDKAKLDTLKSEWFGTQSQFDEIAEKGDNTLYFITEE